MKFALLNNVKIEAQKGLKGFCPFCNSELTAKCGEYKVNHWSHKRSGNCDPWWETETEWHRAWKNNYLTEWQEVSFEDQISHEKHIADIYTSYSLVIEFQHSHIDPKERTKRELFYKNIVWVVDGTRLKRDYSRFLKASKDFKKIDEKGIFLVEFFEDVFPSSWINCKVPVIFDFKGLEDLSDKTDKRHKLYCLFQVKYRGKALLAEISKDAFIKTTINGEWTVRTNDFIESLISKLEQPAQNQSLKTKSKQSEETHYYDQKKGRFVRKWRF